MNAFYDWNNPVNVLNYCPATLHSKMKSYHGILNAWRLDHGIVNVFHSVRNALNCRHVILSFLSRNLSYLNRVTLTVAGHAAHVLVIDDVTVCLSAWPLDHRMDPDLC